ncbi:MAG: Flp pilus assembly complex ATPase component TadA [Chloroflexi bacterium]|nr:Flp pilus assembly complex ATPase component TadA [Chloroflexota bacterium]
MQQRITDDLDALLGVLPPHLEEAVRQAKRSDELLEMVLDLGRLPEARFIAHEVTLNDQEVSREELDYVVERIGEFTTDNRAGIERTLHRISCIRNRQGAVVGLTCRVGRAVYGVIDIVQDIVESDKNILLLGRPGVGKTTLLREAARILSEQRKRVVVVDTSNEIGGDGDIPHPAIGRARRMQVPTPALQHEVMIEAVENHMPEVIIIDEIGRELEAAAARTIAERGVQLIGTAHGNTLDNLLMNPTLADLVGGIESVTLSDEEARRRGTQKTVLERRAPPTFDVVVEIQDRQRLAVHHDVSAAVDALLRRRPLSPELRYRDEEGQVQVADAPAARRPLPEAERRAAVPQMPPDRALRIYPYGIGKNKLQQAAQNLDIPLQLVDKVSAANMVVTLKNYYRRRPRPISTAEERGIPVYVLRSNTVRQMEACMAEIVGLPVEPVDSFAEAMRETDEAIRRVLAGTEIVELQPQPAFIRRQQHEMAREARLVSHSQGREPRRRVRIYREER